MRIFLCLDKLGDLGAQWVWKDGKGEFEKLLQLFPDHQSEIVKEGTLDGLSIFALEVLSIRVGTPAQATAPASVHPTSATSDRLPSLDRSFILIDQPKEQPMDPDLDG